MNNYTSHPFVHDIVKLCIRFRTHSIFHLADCVDTYKQLHIICATGPDKVTSIDLLRGITRQGRKKFAVFLAGEAKKLWIFSLIASRTVAWRTTSTTLQVPGRKGIYEGGREERRVGTTRASVTRYVTSRDGKTLENPRPYS
jgi:hypothetical protein